MKEKIPIIRENHGLSIIKNKVVLLFLILFSLFFIIYISIFNKISEGKKGYYYSNYLVNPKNYSNTNNLKEINGKIETISPEHLLIKMTKKNADDVVFFRGLFGRESDYNMDTNGIFINSIKIYDNNLGSIYSIDDNKRIGYFEKVMKNVGEDFFVKAERASLDNDMFIRRIEFSSIPHNLFMFHIFNKWLLYSTLIIFILFLLLSSLNIIKTNRAILFLLFLIILLFAFMMRFQECLRVFYVDVDSDARGYFSYAQRITLFDKENGFFSGNFWIREPFFPFISKLFLAVWGFNLYNMRFISLYLAIVAMVLTFLLTYRFSRSYLISIFSIFLLANSHTLIEQSSYGLRTELETILFLILFYSLFSKKDLSFKNILLSGISGGLLLLTRWHYIIAVVLLPTLSYLFFRDKHYLLEVSEKSSKTTPETSDYTDYSRLHRFFCQAFNLCNHKIRLFQSSLLKNRMKALLLSLAIIFALFLPHHLNMIKNLRKVGETPFTTYVTYSAALEGVELNRNKDTSFSKYIFSYHGPKYILAPAAGAVLAISYLPLDLMNLRIYFNDILRSIHSKSLKMCFQFPIHFIFILITFLLMLGYAFIESKKRMFIIFSTIFLGFSFNILFYGISVIGGKPIIDTIRTIQPVQPFIAYLLGYTIAYIVKRIFRYSKLIY